MEGEGVKGGVGLGAEFNYEPKKRGAQVVVHSGQPSLLWQCNHRAMSNSSDGFSQVEDPLHAVITGSSVYLVLFSFVHP